MLGTACDSAADIYDHGDGIALLESIMIVFLILILVVGTVAFQRTGTCRKQKRTDGAAPTSFEVDNPCNAVTGGIPLRTSAKKAGQAMGAQLQRVLSTSSTSGIPVPDKYIVAEQQIRIGKPHESTHGLQMFLGLSGSTLGGFLQDPIGAIKREFETHGTAEDKSNFQRVFDGSFDGKMLEQLVAHKHAKKAKLETQHVLALRLYTTSSFARVNDPLRVAVSDPSDRKHPFAATTWFIDDAIRKLRAVAADLPNAHTTLVYWRGLKDLGLTVEFQVKGGTEFACMSASASKEVAIGFAASDLPLVFKFQSKDFTSRGADISFLSVHPAEQEALFPPLTYLRPVKTGYETLGGAEMLVMTVQPVFM
jgi:hypothetical protein